MINARRAPAAVASRRSLSYYRRPPQPTSSEVAQLLPKYATSPPRPINLSKLLSFGRPLTDESVLDSVSYTLAEIPRRLATRVRSVETLPFIVGTNPYIAKTLHAFRDSFLTLATYPPVTTAEENARFTELLANLVQSHANDIPTLAKGFQECYRYISPIQISTFLDGAIRSRISVRLIAEQHITLTQALADQTCDRRSVSIVNRHCSPKRMIQMCSSYVAELCEATLGASPSVKIDGDVDATFAYVPVHLEYILTEILKNSFRATVEHHAKEAQNASKPLPPVTITLSPPARSSNNEGNFFSFRVRDQGGGISPSNMARIFSYAFTTAGRSADECAGGPYAAQHVGGIAAVGTGGPSAGANVFGEITGKGLQTGLGIIAGLGYGLPMSRLYARYFGGSMDLLSLEGWGSDVFLKLRCLDEAVDSTI